MIVTMDTLNKKYLEGNPKYIHKFLSPEEVKNTVKILKHSCLKNF